MLFPALSRLPLQWASIIKQAADATQVDTALLLSAVKEMAQPLSTLLGQAEALGIRDFLAPKMLTIENNLQQLEKL